MIYLPHQINGGTTVANTVLNFINNTKRITIDEKEGFKSRGDVTFKDVIDLCLNAIVSNALKVVELAVMAHDKQYREINGQPADLNELYAQRKALTAHIYDQMNIAFQQTLETFAPDISAHPGLTELAILKAEDDIINAYLASLPEDQVDAARKAAEEMLAQSKRKLLQHIEDINQKKEAADAAFTPLTPEQDKALHVLADPEATEEDRAAAEAVIAEHPLPCMTPAVEQGEEVPEFTATPSKAEFDDCGAICSQCENEVCKKSPTVEKILGGLE